MSLRSHSSSLQQLFGPLVRNGDGFSAGVGQATSATTVSVGGGPTITTGMNKPPQRMLIFNQLNPFIFIVDVLFKIFYFCRKSEMF